MPGTIVTDNDVTLLKGGVATGPNKASASGWPAATPATASYTWSGADLAGFVATDFNAANFGVRVSVTATGAAVANASVDYVQITIAYTVNGVQSSMTMMGCGK
jgi:hypothetical protein